MDDLVRLPGTKLRFGLDPIIGLLPGLGDSASAIISAFALIQATRLGIPKVALARMSLNVLINELVGIIPGFGDAFSFWFKSNARNYRILQACLASPKRPRRSDWIFVGAVLGLVVLFVIAGLAISFFILHQILQFVVGR